jgi:hypothetical protein
MRIDIEFLDFRRLQIELDSAVGPGTFTVSVDKNTVPRQIYLECADDIDSSIIAQANAIAAAQSQEEYLAVQLSMYDRIDRAAGKTIDRRTPKPCSAEQVAQATAWLADQATPCPEFIQDRAFLQSITAVAAAQSVVDSQAGYQEFLDQVAVIRQSGKAAILAAATFYEVKLAGGAAMDQLTALEAQNQ